jgi:hypothetical protein
VERAGLHAADAEQAQAGAHLPRARAVKVTASSEEAGTAPDSTA